MKLNAHDGAININSDEPRKIVCGNMDKIKLEHRPDGRHQISPFILFQAGDAEENGEEYVSEIAEAVEDANLDVPYFITGMPISIFIVAEL